MDNCITNSKESEHTQSIQIDFMPQDRAIRNSIKPSDSNQRTCMYSFIYYMKRRTKLLLTIGLRTVKRTIMDWSGIDEQQHTNWRNGARRPQYFGAGPE